MRFTWTGAETSRLRLENQGLGSPAVRIQHNVLSNMTSFLSLHVVQCVDCHVARKGGSPVDVVKSSWERRCWFGPSRGAGEAWTGGQLVWDDRAFACLLLSSFPFLLTFVDFSTFRKSQDHAPKSKGPPFENQRLSNNFIQKNANIPAVSM